MVCGMGMIPTYKRRRLGTLKYHADGTPKDRPSAHKRGYGRDWRALREAQPHTPCVMCQREWQAAFHLDHIVPKSKGGGDEPSTLQWLCRECNCRKGNKTDGRHGHAPS